MKIENFYQTYFKDGNVTTDTRKIKVGDIFIALKGDNFDGNLFALAAIEAGASVAVVDTHIDAPGAPLVRVGNSLHFLQQLANFHRKNSGFKVLAITGTNGKTTTKELILSVLQQKFRTQATEGNLNNHIGVPLTLLAIKKDTEIAIVEMGANHEGEIETLCSIAEPDCGLITNIGKAHLEGFGSFEGVKRAKSELYASLMKKGGEIFINMADEILVNLVGSYPKLIRYNEPEQLTASSIQTIPSLSLELANSSGRKVQIHSGLFGEYNLNNILAAAAVGQYFQIGLESIKSGVESYIPGNYRSQVIQLGKSRLILDCYNANPTSMSLAIQEFGKMTYKKKIAILGSMKELGSVSHAEHSRIREMLEEEGVSTAILIGKEFAGSGSDKITTVDTAEDAIPLINRLNLEDAAILLKGSRANRLEQLEEIIRKKIAG